jgi:hypothetical protein
MPPPNRRRRHLADASQEAREVRQRISQESTPSSSHPAQTNSQSRCVAEMVAQMALGCQRVFEDVIIDSDDGDDAQIDEEEEGEDDDVHNDEHEEADEDPFAFIPVDDGSSQPVLSVPPPLVGDSVGKTCANPDDPARMTYSVNEDEFNTYTPIFTKICSFCNALRLPNETSDTCCATGKVGLTKKWFKIPPAEIREIYKDALFQKHSITINKVLSFVIDLSDLKNDSLTGNKCAIITGSVTVKVGGLIPPEGTVNGTRYAEIWTMDNPESSRQRHLELLDLLTSRNRIINGNLRSGMTLPEYEKIKHFVTVLHTYMQQHNVFCQQFRTTVQQMQSDYPNGVL